MVAVAVSGSVVLVPSGLHWPTAGATRTASASYVPVLMAYILHSIVVATVAVAVTVVLKLFVTVVFVVATASVAVMSIVSFHR